ncbi:MAG: amidohydrolase family protein [Acidobacteriota bacterium]
MKIVDAWMQHPTPDFLSDPIFASLFRWTKQEKPSEVPLESTIAALNAASVDKALVSAWYGPNGPMISNEEVASWVVEAPDLLVGVGSVDLRRPRQAVLEIRRCIQEFGFKAIRVLPWLWNLPPDDRRYYPVYSECVELGVPFCLQVGHTGPLCPSEPGRPIPYLETVALEFPELTIVAGHIGFPWTAEMVSLATKFPNVYIDTSAYKPKRYPAELVAYLRGHGRLKVMFGSNYPMITPADCLSSLDVLEMTETDLEPFLWRTADKVFDLGLAESAT